MVDGDRTLRRIHWIGVLVASLLAIVSTALIISQALNPSGNPRVLVLSTVHAESDGSATTDALDFPLKLTMRLNKTELEPGESLYVTLTVENVGDQTLTMSFSDGADAYDFKIYNESGICIYRRLLNAGFFQIRVPIPVNPHGSLSDTFEWHPNVPAGIYRIGGGFKSVYVPEDHYLETLSITCRILE